MTSWLTRRLQAADRAHQNVPPWAEDETIEKHPVAWGTFEGATVGVWGAVAGAVLGGAVALRRRYRGAR